MIEYEIIRSTFRDRRARRSGLPYIRHIDQGLLLLEAMNESRDVRAAWCMHPLFQLDEFFVPLMSRWDAAIPSKVVALAMEYRSVANAFLTKDTYERNPKVSPIAEVNSMLVADKLQNWRDARLHVFPHLDEPGQARLNYYFEKWIRVLRVSSEQRTKLEAVLVEDDLWSRKNR